MSKLETEDKFTYNPVTKKYVFHTEEKFGRNIVMGENKVNKIIELYSDFDKMPMTMGEIALKTGIPKDVVRFIILALKITHASLPFTKEKIDEGDADSLVEEMIQSKEFNIHQKFEKLDWKAIQADADKWRGLQHFVLDPIDSFLQNWNPPKYIPKKYKYEKAKTDEEFLIGASDWHYGLYANQRYLYSAQEWDIEKTVEAVDSYCGQLKEHLKKNKYKTVRLLFLGDLIHTLTGFTDKGTKLEANPIGEEQLDAAFNSMVAFVEGLLEVHDNIKVYACPGNHSSLGDYVVVRMLELYFKQDKRLSFDITNKRNIVFRSFDNLFLMEHGYSAVSRDRLPANKSQRERYINNLFMAKPELFNGAKHFYYLSGDQHHTETYELTNVEGFMFPTLVGGCRHADNSGYKSRSRQSCLVVSPKGVTEMKHFYFD
jgi:hypothetical protein